MRKNNPSVNKIFFQVTEVEKGHQGKVFEAEAVGQGLEMFPRCPFSTKVTWKKFLFTRGLFSKQIFQDNYDNRLLFRIVMVFSYKRGDHPCWHSFFHDFLPFFPIFPWFFPPNILLFECNFGHVVFRMKYLNPGTKSHNWSDKKRPKII